ncbi:MULTISPECIES: hypothetical protein [Mucilaginibacter]|uniref:hypothetical protein n=1 Tax=Mucilaginibacter TaxID=423349 RepID=UPI00025559EE|nr:MULTISPECIES: hypothetical protein [Mucilaginibacter]
MGSRFYYRAFGQKIDIELSSDGFLESVPVVIDRYGKNIAFSITSRIPEPHNVDVLFEGIKGGYKLILNGKLLFKSKGAADGSVNVKLPIGCEKNSVILKRIKAG